MFLRPKLQNKPQFFSSNKGFPKGGEGVPHLGEKLPKNVPTRFWASDEWMNAWIQSATNTS